MPDDPKPEKAPQKDEAPDAALAILQKLTEIVEKLSPKVDDAKDTKDDGKPDGNDEREPKRRHWFFG